MRAVDIEAGGAQVSAAVPTPDNTVALVVTWFPGATVAQLIKTIAPQVRSLVVIDNHSPEPALKSLRGLVAQHGGALIENCVNSGLAAAYNQGLEQAAAMPGIDWVLLFDQDSEPEPVLLAALSEVYRAYPSRERIGLIGSNYRDREKGGVLRPTDEDESPWTRSDYSISSGSLVALHAARAAGGFRSEFFVDYIDYDLCFRLLDGGYHILVSRKVVMTHSVGRPSAGRLFGAAVYTSNHSAQRRYYMTRNHVVLIREQLRRRPRWALYAIYSRLRSTLLMLLFESDRGPKLRSTWLGFLDGLRSDFRHSPLAHSNK